MPKRAAPPDDESAELLVDVRTQLGITQVEAAEILGVSEDTIGSWERERTVPPKWLRLALVGLMLVHGRSIKALAG